MLTALIHTYYDIKQSLIESGYADEIDWQHNISTKNTTESDLIREIAWVILSSGFFEGTIRKIFPCISECFFDWECISKINSNSTACVLSARNHFNNKIKIQSIANSARIIEKESLQSIMKNLENEGPQYLSIFPYIGNTTCYHLAKNIGYHTPKPDRHLSRISSTLGYRNTFDLCDAINAETGDPTHEIDIVFWRYANINRDYESKILSRYKKYISA